MTDDSANPWTKAGRPKPKAKAKGKAPAKGRRPAAKASAAKARGASPRSTRAKRPARKPRAAAAPAAAPAPERPPLDFEVRMRPVRPEPQTRRERLAAQGLVVPAAPGAPPAPAPALAPTPVQAAAPAAEPKRRRFRLRSLLAGGIVVALALAVVAALPTMSQGNSGTIKVHDGSGADPDERNEPHVVGDAFVEGFNMAADGGDLLFYSWPPTGDMTLALATTWDADDAEPEFHFLAGPFELPCGHYRVFAYNGDGPEDPTVPDEGGAKKKNFWVECETPPEEEPPVFECPTGLTAVANPDGTVTLFWNDAPGSDGTNVYRATDGGEFEYLGTAVPEAESYQDTTTVPGTTYEYTVTGLFGDSESRQCGVVEVTAIPEFPTVVGLGLATVGGALALLLRRRKE